MKFKAIRLFLFTLILLVAGTAFASAKPVIKADQTYFDVNTGLYVLNGNVTVIVGNRTITAGQAKVSMATLEVWGSGGITLTQDDIYFSGDSIYVYGVQKRAKIDGGVVFKRTGLTIEANNVSYCWDTKLAVFSGNATVTQDGMSPVTSDTVTYNVGTGTFQ